MRFHVYPSASERWSDGPVTRSWAACEAMSKIVRIRQRALPELFGNSVWRSVVSVPRCEHDVRLSHPTNTPPAPLQCIVRPSQHQSKVAPRSVCAVGEDNNLAVENVTLA